MLYFDMEIYVTLQSRGNRDRNPDRFSAYPAPPTRYKLPNMAIIMLYFDMEIYVTLQSRVNRDRNPDRFTAYPRPTY